MNKHGGVGIWILVFLLIVGVIGLSGAWVIRTELGPVAPFSQDKKLINVVRGETPSSVSNKLEAEGLIRNATIFRYAGRVFGTWASLKAGEYELSPSMSGRQISAILIRGLSKQYPVTIPEGFNSYEVASLLKVEGKIDSVLFLKLTKDREFIKSLGFFKGDLPESLEGFLFPDTYLYTRNSSAQELLKTMVRRFFAAWKTVPGAEAIPDAQLFRTVTLASMVEKETGAPEERPRIAGVFVNRLKKGMKLQSDPTTIYGMWERYKGNISRNDLITPSPYNTYTVPALPKGPIANPGVEALKAVLAPETHEFLYFVSKNDGTHV
ncbi:MAG: endolytic transglycosylase MltG, partial [Proteobacteria bacterium]